MNLTAKTQWNWLITYLPLFLQLIYKISLIAGWIGIKKINWCKPQQASESDLKCFIKDAIVEKLREAEIIKWGYYVGL